MFDAGRRAGRTENFGCTLSLYTSYARYQLCKPKTLVESYVPVGGQESRLPEENRAMTATKGGGSDAALQRLYYGTEQPPRRGARPRGRTRSPSNSWMATCAASATPARRCCGGIAYLVRDRDWGTCRRCSPGSTSPQTATASPCATPPAATVPAATPGHRGPDLRLAGRQPQFRGRGDAHRAISSPPGAASACCTRFSASPAAGRRGARRRQRATRHPARSHRPLATVQDIRAITHVVRPGLRAICRLEADDLRDGGPAQLVGCLRQDLRAAAGAAVAVRPAGRRRKPPEGHAALSPAPRRNGLPPT